MIRQINPLLFLLLILIMNSCDGFKVPSTLFATSERAKYERQFSGSDSLLNLWKNDFLVASKNQLKINDGYSGIIPKERAGYGALGYSINLKQGDQLIVETLTTGTISHKIFVDFYEISNGESASKSEIIKNGSWNKYIEKDGVYKVIIQPEIEYSESFSLKIYTQPSFQFPVAGKGNRDAQSFWGASRDGGDRKHEGVDIFGSRGTPVVAVTNGFIIRTGNQGLGGKQVWLRDEIFGNSVYYAHLDSILAETGTRVKIGDTLGLVGNTGNAKGGATHLHFGIYSTGGAVDAYPFIEKRAVPKSLNKELKNYKLITSDSNIRNGPGTQYDVTEKISKETAVTVLLGNEEWYHIKTIDGKEGFVNSGRLK